MNASSLSRGRVYLVGAGPGAPDLLTLRALKLIQSAQVVVYDRLVSSAIMDLVPETARVIDVGKLPGYHRIPQEQINRLLVELACEGNEVIRLKGGDPYIFGRGSEEAAACQASGIPVEIVPGITAAQGASAASGVPLTHRGLSTGVRYITGHRAANAELDVDWDQVADPAATLVIYMGVANIAEIAARLIRAGLPSFLPVLAAASVTTSHETLLRSTLSRIGIDAAKLPQDAPVLFIVGRVVELYPSPQAVMEALCHA